MMRRILICLLMFLTFQTQAIAATYPVIVQLKTATNLSSVLSALGGGNVLDSIPGTNIYLLGLSKLPVIGPLSPALSLLGVQFIEYDKLIGVPAPGPVGLLSVSGSTAADWYKNQPALQVVRAREAASYSTGRGIVVADLNSKVDYGHPALVGHLTGGYDFVMSKSSYSGTLDQSSTSYLDSSSTAFLDSSSTAFLDSSSTAFLDSSSTAFLDQSAATFLDQSAATFLDGGNPAASHGTLCAAIIAAVAPDSMIMPLRVFDDRGNANVFSIAKAAYYAVQNGAKVINMSFGMSESYKSIQAALSDAAGKGVQVIASAGNRNLSTPQFPASVGSVIAVAATDVNDVKASFSNYGGNIYVSAPGKNVISAYPGGYYAVVSGTSFSAPIVAAETALIMSIKSSSAKTVVGGAVVNIDKKNPSYAGVLGKGRVDLLKAVKP